MGEVVSLADYRGCELLASLNIFREPDGRILLGVTYMAPQQIESRETISERFELLASMVREGLPSLAAQADDFRDQTDG